MRLLDLAVVWAVVMAGFACLFTDTKGQLGLGIAGYYKLGFTWYVPLGVLVRLLVGYLLSLTHEPALAEEGVH